MNKIIRLGSLPREGNIFARIQFKDSKLSISGVIGPMRNGAARGSSGQFIMSFKEYDARGHLVLADVTPAPAWSPELIKRFFDVWNRWHLNDMRAGCEHQKGSDWNTTRQLTLYHFRLTTAAQGVKKAAEEAALSALRRGEVFQPTALQAEMSALPYALTHHEPALPARGQFYEPKMPLWTGDRGATETRLACWLRPDEHPSGLLGKPCGVCGYKYGTAWKSEDVPADVLEFLRSLPETDTQPAWV